MALDLQPTFHGEYVHLRPMREGDWDGLFAVASDRLIWEQHPSWNRYQEPVFRKLFQEGLDSKGALLAVDALSGEVIGSSRFRHDPERGEIEIGWTFLARSHWGGKYNREMKRLMLGHAFRFVDRVVFLIGPDNTRSRTSIERIGAVLTDRRVNPTTGIDSVEYSFTREQFEELLRRG